MARVKNTMKLIEESIGRINARYDMRVRDVLDIKENSNDPFELICNSFRFGYTQGAKAAKAEMRKGGVA